MINTDLCCFAGYIFSESPHAPSAYKKGFPVRSFIETSKYYDYATIIDNRLVVFDKYSIVEEIPITVVAKKFFELVQINT